MFVIEVSYIDLNHIYKSGQMLRWIKLRDDKYVVVNGCKALKVEQQRDRFDKKKCRLIMSCSEQDFYETWFNYFDMSTDYSEPFYRMGKNEMFLKICAARGHGVRIIKQDLFESIIASVISSLCNNDIAMYAIKMLVFSCGTKHVQSMREAGRITWYEFPTPETIVNMQDELDQKYFGIIKDNILNICNNIIDGWLDLDLLKGMSYHDARDYLLQFDEIDVCAADRICLYGLHHICAFPQDEVIDNILLREFDCDSEIFVPWFIDDVDEYKGLVYQYIMHNELNPPKKSL